MAEGMGVDMGLVELSKPRVSYKHHGKHGSPVTPLNRARHSQLEYDGETDADQPSRGGVAYPGVRGGVYDSGNLGAPEEIAAKVAHFTGPDLEPELFGGKRRARTPNGGTPHPVNLEPIGR